MNTTGANCSAQSPDDQSYEYYLFPPISIVALIVGLPGNLAALFYFTFKLRPRSSFSVFIVNLALVDVTILCTLPFRVHYYLSHNNWVFGNAACQITGTLFHAGMYLNFCFMTCICVDRYFAIIHPHVYLKSRKAWLSTVASVLLWSVAGVAMLIFGLTGPLISKHRQSGSSSCFENFNQDEWRLRLKAFSAFCLVFGSLLPSAIILVCYPTVARRISTIKTKTAQRALRIIYAILAITVLCFLPYHLVYLLHVLGHSEVIRSCPVVSAIHVARRVTVALAIFNTCLDPVLYYITTGHCKRPKTKWINRRIGRKRGVYTIAAP